MVRTSLGWALLVGMLCIASFAAAQPSDSPPPKLPVLTQDQYSIYLACLEESSLASAKDANPLATVNELNTRWVKTVKQTSLKNLTMLQLTQVTDHSIRALAAQQFGKANLTGKVFREFATQTPTGCLTLAQSLVEP